MAKKPVSGIYEIVNLTNGKRYIGSAVDLRVRFHVHRHNLKRGKHHNRALQRAWVKYGETLFAFRKLLFCRPIDLLLYEQSVFEAFKPEYNICRIAGNCLGVKWSEEARARQSRIQKLNPPMKGRKHSAEALAKMSESQKGKTSPTKGKKRASDAVARTAAAHRGMKRSDETRLRISLALKGKKHRHPRSDESRARMSAARVGKSISSEHMAAFQAGRARRIYTQQDRENLSVVLKAQYRNGTRNRARSAEYREKIAQSLKGRRLSDAHRANVSAAMRGKKRGPYRKKCEADNEPGLFDP